MIVLNIANVEKLVFFDQELKNKLPSFSYIFDQWRISQLAGIKKLKMQNLLNFINSLEKEHIEILEKYFNDVVKVSKIDYNIVKNSIVDIDLADEEMNNQAEGFQPCLYRKGNQLYISYWR